MKQLIYFLLIAITTPFLQSCATGSVVVYRPYPNGYYYYTHPYYTPYYHYYPTPPRYHHYNPKPFPHHNTHNNAIPPKPVTPPKPKATVRKPNPNGGSMSGHRH